MNGRGCVSAPPSGRSYLRFTIVGVRNITLPSGTDSPPLLTAKVTAGTVTSTTSPHRPIVHAASRTLACPFDEVLNLPVTSNLIPRVTITLLWASGEGGRKTPYGEVVLDNIGSGSAAGTSSWLPLSPPQGQKDDRRNRGEVHCSWGFSNALGGGWASDAIGPSLTRTAPQVHGKGTFHSLWDEPSNNKVSFCPDASDLEKLPGPGTLHLNVSRVTVAALPNTSPPLESLFVLCTFGGQERQSGLLPYSREVDFNFLTEFDMVYSEGRSVLSFSLWGRPRKGYEDIRLGEGIVEVASSAPASHQFVPLHGGHEVCFRYRITFQRPFQEGSSGRPKSAHPHKKVAGGTTKGSATHDLRDEGVDDDASSSDESASPPPLTTLAAHLPSRPSSSKASRLRQEVENDRRVKIGGVKQEARGEDSMGLEGIEMQFERQSGNGHTSGGVEWADEQAGTLRALSLLSTELETRLRSMEGRILDHIGALESRVSTLERRVDEVEAVQASPPASPPPLRPPSCNSEHPPRHTVQASSRPSTAGTRVTNVSSQCSQSPNIISPSIGSRPSSGKSIGDESSSLLAPILSNDINGVLVTEEQLQRKFHELDTSGVGWIPLSTLRKFYRSYDSFGVEETDRQVDKMLSKFISGDKVNYQQFATVALSLAKR